MTARIYTRWCIVGRRPLIWGIEVAGVEPKPGDVFDVTNGKGRTKSVTVRTVDPKTEADAGLDWWLAELEGEVLAVPADALERHEAPSPPIPARPISARS